MKGLIFEMSCQDHNQISLPSSVHVVVLLLSEKEEKIRIKYGKVPFFPKSILIDFHGGKNLKVLVKNNTQFINNNEILRLLVELLGCDPAMVFQKSSLSRVLMNLKSKELCEKVDF